MSDLDIVILSKELVDVDGLLDISLNLDKENTYLSIEFNNIPRILSKIILDKKILIPYSDYDMEKIKMIYFSSLSDYEKFNKIFNELCKTFTYKK